MSYCVRVKTPDGHMAIIRMSGRRPPPCVKCGAISSRLCDWKLAPAGAPPRRLKTCSAPLCADCASSPAPDKDLCPTHAAMWSQHLERQKTET